jgi:hypothetical protein
MRSGVFYMVAALLLMVASAHGQLLSMSFANSPADEPNAIPGGVRLSTTCGGNTFISDSTGRIVVYQDFEPAGPGPEDRPLPLCAHAPVCTGNDSIGSFNKNTFVMNGKVSGYDSGWFGTDYTTAFGNMPPQPWRYYCKVFYPAKGNPEIEWVSNSVTVASPQPYDFYLTKWTCNSLKK